MRFGRGIEHIQNPLAPYMAESGMKCLVRERSFGNTEIGDEINALTWEEFRRLYEGLVEAECTSPEIATEVARRAHCVVECAQGSFPSELFDVRTIDGKIVAVTFELLEEVRYYVRHMVGKDPALSPSASADVPFQFESSVLGQTIQVSFRGEFARFTGLD